MSEQPEKKRQNFTSIPNVLFDDFLELSMHEKGVLFTIMRHCWKEEVYKLSLREIAKLADIQFSNLRTKTGENPREGILDKYQRLGIIRFVTTKPEKRRPQTYISICYAYLWERNDAFYAAKKEAKSNVLDEHSTVLQEHTSVLDEHTSVLPEHSTVFDASTKVDTKTGKTNEDEKKIHKDSLERDNLQAVFSSSQSSSQQEGTNQEENKPLSELALACLETYSFILPCPLTPKQVQASATYFEELATMLLSSNGNAGLRDIQFVYTYMGQGQLPPHK